MARDLGIPMEALRSWVRLAKADASERDERLTTVERDELKELRKKVAELGRVHEILKTASVLPGDRPSPDEAELGVPPGGVIDHPRDGFGGDPACRLLELSPSTYFARRPGRSRPGVCATRS
ncbi:transposase [Kitasatospora indigofera]|uniref:transposase n=1 Tax=Kitasatospora indigofera TaxID=67307 RepID=UPI0033BDFEF8